MSSSLEEHYKKETAMKLVSENENVSERQKRRECGVYSSRLWQHSGRNLKSTVVEDWSVLGPLFLASSTSTATSSF